MPTSLSYPSPASSNKRPIMALVIFVSPQPGGAAAPPPLPPPAFLFPPPLPRCASSPCAACPALPSLSSLASRVPLPIRCRVSSVLCVHCLLTTVRALHFLQEGASPAVLVQYLQYIHACTDFLSLVVVALFIFWAE